MNTCMCICDANLTFMLQIAKCQMVVNVAPYGPLPPSITVFASFAADPFLIIFYIFFSYLFFYND